jgi:hypothetical protein
MAEDRLGPIIESAVDRLLSTAASSGYFSDSVSYEPKSAPGPGLFFSTWIGDIKPIAAQSGLDVTSCRVEMNCRVYRNMITEPQNTIDIELAKASSYLLAQLTGDFGIDGAYIDLLGAHGEPLGTTLGYIELDKSMFRVADTVVPFIADDVFDQEV